jgi:hypothetical protein
MQILGLGVWEWVIVLPLLLIALSVYFAPSIIAIARRVSRMAGIVALNVLAGWTFIGWIVALVWALKASKKRLQSNPNE